MSTLRTTPVSGVSFLVLAGVLWGTGGLLGSLFGAAAGLSPLAVATYRLGVGGLLIVGYLLVSGSALPRSGAAWRRIAATGLLAALFQASYFTAVSLTSVSLATLVTIGSSPVLVLLVRRRHAGRRQLAAVALALLGLALLVGLPADGPAAPGAGAVLAGSAFALLAAAGFSVMTLLAARPVPGLDEATTTGLGFTIGGALLLPARRRDSRGRVRRRRAVGRPARRARPGPDGRGLHVLLPRAALGVGGRRGADGPARTADRGRAGGLLLGDRLGVAGVAGGLLLGVALVLAARSA